MPLRHDSGPLLRGFGASGRVQGPCAASIFFFSTSSFSLLVCWCARLWFWGIEFFFFFLYFLFIIILLLYLFGGERLVLGHRIPPFFFSCIFFYSFTLFGGERLWLWTLNSSFLVFFLCVFSGFFFICVGFGVNRLRLQTSNYFLVFIFFWILLCLCWSGGTRL